MTGRIEARLQACGVVLPSPEPSAGRYAPFVRRGALVQLAGVAPSIGGRYQVVGKLGETLSLEDGRRAAELCAHNLLAALKVACSGDLDRVEGFLSLRGYVNAHPGFEPIPRVIDAASEMILDVFGEDIGRHARTSIGCASLPSGVAVEIDALVMVGSS